eukprot:gene6559-7299_t
MAEQILFVWGKTCFSFDKCNVDTDSLRKSASRLLGIDEESLYLTYNGKCLDEDSQLKDELSIVQCNCRLAGGKGGFGSMLRAMGAQIEKTTNREACRDLSGRRMRDVNNEKKLDIHEFEEDLSSSEGEHESVEDERISVEILASPVEQSKSCDVTCAKIGTAEEQSPLRLKREQKLLGKLLTACQNDSIDLHALSSAEELEAFGLEKLKNELIRHGLKCGGTLQQRAQRLFLLKDTPIDQLDASVFAKAGKKNKKGQQL